MSSFVEDNRLKVSNMLHCIANGAKVYYQPPENVKLVYPCIIYNRSRIENQNADNFGYKHSFFYDVTVISKQVDDQMFIDLLNYKDNECFLKTDYKNRLVKDNLYHDYFTITTH